MSDVDLVANTCPLDEAVVHGTRRGALPLASADMGEATCNRL